MTSSPIFARLRASGLLGVLALSLSLQVSPVHAQVKSAPSAPAIAAPATAGAPASAMTASPEVSKAIKGAIETWTNNRYKVDEVRKTPIPGMYEARIGSDLFYVDEKAQYIFMEGHMLDMKNNRDLTRERLDEVLAINFKDLPLELALKQVNGKGTRKIALFEDPNCGYCRKLRADLVGLPDVTIYTFAYPILAADSDIKSRKAWCAKDRNKAWTDMMLSGKVPDNDGNCSNPIARIKELGRKYNVSATPTVFLTNGRRIQGYMPAEQFAKAIADSL